MNTLVSRLGRGCDVTLCALAEVLPQTSGQLQVNLLKLGQSSNNIDRYLKDSILIIYI